MAELLMRDSLALSAFSGICFLIAFVTFVVGMRAAAHVFGLGAIVALTGAFICSAIEKRR